MKASQHLGLVNSQLTSNDSKNGPSDSKAANTTPKYPRWLGELFAMFAANFRDFVSGPMCDMQDALWYQHLKDYSEEDIQTARDTVIRTCEFAPTIAKFLDVIGPIKRNAVLDKEMVARERQLPEPTVTLKEFLERFPHLKPSYEPVLQKSTRPRHGNTPIWQPVNTGGTIDVDPDAT